MEVKNHINNTLVTAKRWPRPLNRGGRWIERSNTAVYRQKNRDFGKWPLNGGWPLNRGRTVFLLPIVNPLGRTFFLSPVFNCLKNSRWRRNFLRCERSNEKLSPALQASQFVKLRWLRFIAELLRAKGTWAELHKFGNPSTWNNLVVTCLRVYVTQLPLVHLWIWASTLRLIDSCHKKLSAEQHNTTTSWA